MRSPLLLLALLLNPAPLRSENTLFLYKMHQPTAAMLKRLCGLRRAAEEAAFPGAFAAVNVEVPSPELNCRTHAEMLKCDERQVKKGGGRIQPMRPNVSYPLPPAADWCPGAPLDVVSMTPEDLEAVFGATLGRTLFWNQYLLAHVPELYFHATQRAKRSYTRLWVFEQDVGWTGNLFDYLASLAAWPEDFLCENHKQVIHSWRWRHAHSGWAEPDVSSASATDRNKSRIMHRCGVWAVRYSRRLLDALLDEHLFNGHWAHCEFHAASLCMTSKTAFPGDEPCQVRNLRDPQFFANAHKFYAMPFRAAMPMGNSEEIRQQKMKEVRSMYRKHAQGLDAPVVLFHPLKF